MERLLYLWRRYAAAREVRNRAAVARTSLAASLPKEGKMITLRGGFDPHVGLIRFREEMYLSVLDIQVAEMAVEAAFSALPRGEDGKIIPLPKGVTKAKGLGNAPLGHCQGSLGVDWDWESQSSHVEYFGPEPTMLIVGSSPTARQIGELWEKLQGVPPVKAMALTGEKEASEQECSEANWRLPPDLVLGDQVMVAAAGVRLPAEVVGETPVTMIDTLEQANSLFQRDMNTYKVPLPY